MSSIPKWRYLSHVVNAHTKSEARAKLKAIVGRLPVGAGHAIQLAPQKKTA